MVKRRRTVGFPKEANSTCKPPEINYDTSIPEHKADCVNIVSTNRKKKKTD